MIDTLFSADSFVTRLRSDHVLQPCWNAQLSGLDADVLSAALTIGAFRHLVDFISIEALAKQLNRQICATTYLVELLWSMHVLELGRDASGPPLYRLEPRFRPYLDVASEHYCGDALLHRYQVLRQAGEQFRSVLLIGQPGGFETEASELQHRWAQAAQTQIGQEQRAITVDIATQIMKGQEGFLKRQRMLDLGAGPGLVAIALARANPELSVVVFEYPAVAAVIRENVEISQVADRVEVCEGDLATDDFGGDYDLIWCASVLHFVPDVPSLLARIYNALRPGGVFVSCHAEIDRDPDKAHPVLQYYLGLRMQGRFVSYQGQLATMLEQAGLRLTDQIHDVRFPVAPVSVLVARKD